VQAQNRRSTEANLRIDVEIRQGRSSGDS